MSRTYEPKGRVTGLIVAMKAEPERIWSASEVAAILKIHVREVSAYTKYPLKNGVFYRGGSPRARVYSLTPFTGKLRAPKPVFKSAPPVKHTTSWRMPSAIPKVASVWELGRPPVCWPTGQTGSIHMLLTGAEEEEAEA